MEILISRKGSYVHSDALTVSIECHMPIPASWSKIRRLKAVGEPHPMRPDIDNLNKFVFDAFNGMLWTDDSIIVETYSIKLYSLEPKTVIRI